MTRKPDHFSHGYGAVMRAAAGFKYRLVVMAVCVLACAGMAALFAFKTTLTPTDQMLVGWRVRADVAMLAPLPSMRTMRVAWYGRQYITTAADVLASAQVKAAVAAAATRCTYAAFFGALAGVFLAFVWYRRIAARGKEIVGDKHLRGATVATEQELIKAAKRVATSQSEAPPFAHIGSVPIPRHLEPRNFLIAGTVGAGKTTAMRQLLDAAEKRNEGAIVYDPSGDLAAAYYRADRGDVILNPYDSRAAVWDLFADVHEDSDAKLVAESIVQPKQGGRQNEWLAYLSDYIQDAIWSLKKSGRGTTEELLRALAYGDKASLAALVDGLPSRRYFEPGAERATASIVFGLPGALRILTSLRRAPGPGGVFSWTAWASEIDAKSGARPWVFLGAPARQFTVVRSLVTAALEVAAANLLSLDPKVPRRVWLVIDEFASLPVMDAVPRLADQGRKFGYSLVIGVQSPSQLVANYGQSAAATIVNNAGTQLILRLPGGDAARWACAQLGRQEVERRQENDTYDTEDAHARSNVSVSREVRDLVLDSEIASLPDLQGFLRVPAVGVGRVVIATAHLARPFDEVKYPADPNDLWLSHMHGLKDGAESLGAGDPSVAADAEEPRASTSIDEDDFRL